VSEWDPACYGRFAAERTQPFLDLLARVRRRPGMRIADLGCGAGELTARLQDELAADETVALDSSPSMLAESDAHARPGLHFVCDDLTHLDRYGEFDLIFSNAALQWVDDHERLLARLCERLRPGGEIAVQVPANHDHPSHLLAAELGSEPPFAAALTDGVRRSPVLAVEDYASLLFRLGLVEPRVELIVYTHLLPSAASVVEWVQGTLLVHYRRGLPPGLHEPFLKEYAARLPSRLGGEEPYLYTYKRILFTATRPPAPQGRSVIDAS
jgi:trans-aconitate 2-methyltransferase